MTKLELSEEKILAKSLKSCYLKILLNYSQILMIITNVDMKWDAVIQNMYVAQTIPLASNYKTISIDCLLPGFFLKNVNLYPVIIYKDLSKYLKYIYLLLYLLYCHLYFRYF